MQLRDFAAAVALFGIATILACPAATAQGAIVPSSFEFSSIQTSGRVSMDGTFSALRLDGSGMGSMLSIEAPTMTRRTAFESSIAALDGQPRIESGLRREDLPLARLRATSETSEASLGVFAAPGNAVVRLETSAVAVEPEVAQRITETRFVSSTAPSIASSTLDTLVLRGFKDTTSLKIVGSFVVVAWNWDLAGSSAGASRFLSSGPSETHLFSPAREFGLLDQRNEQVYLSVTDGTLELAVAGAPDLRVWSKEITLRSAEHLGATSREGDPLADERQPLRWHLELLAEPHDLSLRSQNGIGQSARAGVADAAVLGTSSVGNAKLGMPVWMDTALIVLAGTVLAPGAALAAVAAHRRFESIQFSRLEDAAETGNMEGTLQLSQALLSSKHYGRDAALMRVEGLVRTNRIEEAGRILTSLGQSDDAHWSASVELLRAYIHVLEGDQAAAAQALARCLTQDAAHYDEVLDNPAFATARSMPEARRAIALVTSAGEAR